MISGTEITDVKILVDKIRDTNNIDTLAASMEKVCEMAQEHKLSVSDYITTCLISWNNLTCY